MKKWTLFTVMLLTITAVVFFVGRSASNQKEEVARESSPSVTASARKRGTEPGSLAPELQVLRLDGSPLSLNDLSGKPAVLVFWASWCRICRDEAPLVNKLAQSYASRGVRVFGINVLESQAQTESGVKDFGIRYGVVRDVDGTTTRRYKVEGIPTVFFLDSESNVRYEGHMLPADYSKRLDALLAEKE